MATGGISGMSWMRPVNLCEAKIDLLLFGFILHLSEKLDPNSVDLVVRHVMNAISTCRAKRIAHQPRTPA